MGTMQSLLENLTVQYLSGIEKQHNFLQFTSQGYKEEQKTVFTLLIVKQISSKRIREGEENGNGE